MPFLTGLLANPVSRTALAVVIAVVVAVAVTAAISATVRAIARRRRWPERSLGRMRRPFRLLLVLAAAWIAVDAALPGTVRDARHNPHPNLTVDHFLGVAVIAAGAWFAGSVVSFLVDINLARYRTDVRDNRAARRIRTQVLVVRRVAIAAIVVVAFAAILLSYPDARAAGASLLASAGVVSIIAGLAAQSTLGNVIAGLQLAFSGAIRIDDVVIVNTEWGRIEEITLTYVVVHLWDDRRLVVPSTFFTTTPFENWTRTSSELMQSVEFDLDWQIDPDAMRDEMHAVLARTTLWDGRVAVLQVTDAVDCLIRVRILLTAIDAPNLFDLRCFVREELVTWLRETNPQALPRARWMRVQPDQVEEEQRRRTPALQTTDRSLFSGDRRSEERARNFTGPIETAQDRPEPR